MSVGYWTFLKRILLEVTDRTFGWTKEPGRHVKHVDGLMVLKTILVRGVNFKKSGRRRPKARKNNKRQRESLEQLMY